MTMVYAVPKSRVAVGVIAMLWALTVTSALTGVPAAEVPLNSLTESTVTVVSSNSALVSIVMAASRSTSLASISGEMETTSSGIAFHEKQPIRLSPTATISSETSSRVNFIAFLRRCGCLPFYFAHGSISIHGLPGSLTPQ